MENKVKGKKRKKDIVKPEKSLIWESIQRRYKYKDIDDLFNDYSSLRASIFLDRIAASEFIHQRRIFYIV